MASAAGAPHGGGGGALAPVPPAGRAAPASQAELQRLLDARVAAVTAQIRERLDASRETLREKYTDVRRRFFP